MGIREVFIIALSVVAALLLFRHSDAIAEAIRRGPWNGGGGGPGGIGPAPAADPFLHGRKRRPVKSDHEA